MPEVHVDFFATIERILQDALLKHGYCLGVPDFTPGPHGQTEGNRKLAEEMTYALAEAGIMALLYAGRESHVRLDGSLARVAAYPIGSGDQS